MESLEKKAWDDRYYNEEAECDVIRRLKEQATALQAEYTGAEKECTCRLSDVLHIIELADTSLWKKIKLYGILLSVLDKRREVKRDLSLVTKYMNKINKVDKLEQLGFIDELVSEREQTEQSKCYRFRTLSNTVMRRGDKITL